MSVERRQGSAAAGRTVLVREGASLVAAEGGGPVEIASVATDFGARPRVRSGYALERLERGEGARRWILRGLGDDDSWLQLSDNDVQLFELLDGENSLVDLIGEAERRFGSTGAARLTGLLAELGERGYLAGPPDSPAPGGSRRRERVVPGLGAIIDRLYRAGGWVLFLRPVLILVRLVAALGIPVLLYLLAGRYGTPFVVASKVGWGLLVFLIGCFAVGALHELAKGLTMVSFGRRVQRAGLRRVRILPSVFVDTLEAWFEPRAHRRRSAPRGCSATSCSARFSRSAAC